MFEEFEEFEKIMDAKPEGELSDSQFHVVETDDPENPHIVGGVPELWAEKLDSVQGDNFFGMNQNCGLVSVSNVERMAGNEDVTETGTCLRAILTGNCLFNIFDIDGSGGSYMEMQENLLDRHGIESTTYYSEDADVERIAEWVENGHGVILNHSTYLSADELDMHYNLDAIRALPPEYQGVIDLADSLQDGESVEVSLSEITGWDISCSLTNDGMDFHLSGDILESLATVDEYGRVLMDHAAAVTGTERDMNGNLLGLRVCDSGWGKGDRFISVENLENCYTNAVNSGVVVTDNPIHVNGNPIKA